MTDLWPPGRLHSQRLDNGLRILVLESEDAPVVTTALTYRVGRRDDPAGFGGLAHFLEHIMFKGSAGWAAGEVDRRTLALGGSNNAYTSHDSSTYYFSFAKDCWEVALEIEADRMEGVLLATDEVESERGVILEEIAMYRSEPWDALDRAVQKALFGSHPYGEPVIGSTEEVRAITVAEIARLHRQFYRPDGAVLVIAGGVDRTVIDRAADLFDSIAPGCAERQPVAKAEMPTDLVRIDIERGETSRLLLALPACSGEHQDQTKLRLLAALLGSGRASRLNRRLVDRDELCAWISAETMASELPGSFVVAAELLPGVAPEDVEAAVIEELAALRDAPVSAPELERARRVLVADWVFDHEHVQRQALTLSHSAAVFDAMYPARQLESLAACSAECLLETAQRYLNVEAGAVLGWGRPSSDGRGDPA